MSRAERQIIVKVLVEPTTDNADGAVIADFLVPKANLEDEADGQVESLSGRCRLL